MKEVYVVTFNEETSFHSWWGNMTAVFSSMEKAEEYVQREMKRLGGDRPTGISYKGTVWAEYYFYNKVGYEVTKVSAYIQCHKVDIELK